jgi:hypothetical protein
MWKDVVVERVRNMAVASVPKIFSVGRCTLLNSVDP